MLKGLLFGLIGLYVLLVVGFLITRVREGGVKALFLKASASLTFTMCAIVSLMIAPENRDGNKPAKVVTIGINVLRNACLLITLLSFKPFALAVRI